MILMAGCQDSGATAVPIAEPTQEEVPTQAVEPTKQVKTATPQPSTLEEVATEILYGLDNKNLAKIAPYVHPEMGVRFSPYGYVSDDDVVFTADGFADLFKDNKRYMWGFYDGIGDPIALTFSEYYQLFVYNAEYINAEQIGYNQQIGQGNSMNNITEYYPGAEFVEYHFSGFDPQYGGMDWQSLRLVFIKEKGQYFLVGIVHAQWTI